MREIYQEASEQLNDSVVTVVNTLRKQIENNDFKPDKVAKQSMAVEIVSFLLVNCLIEERKAFVQCDEKEARSRAMEIVKAGVIQYRGGNLVPLSKAVN